MPDLPVLTLSPAVWKDRLTACILGGSIGDAWGSAFENAPPIQKGSVFYYGTRPVSPPSAWRFTDDTQLSLLTVNALLDNPQLGPEELAEQMLQAYRRHALAGLGSSTLKSLTDLSMGIHWSQAGRSGEFAAGNGAAMRMAAFAFWNHFSRDDIRNFCRITHRNDEAYAGAMAVILAIRLLAASASSSTASNLLQAIIALLPDTEVRDRLQLICEIQGTPTIGNIAAFGVSGYVAHSIPFAIFSAMQARTLGIEEMLRQVIACGGDTDTNASIAGQIAGAAFGISSIPRSLLNKIADVPGYQTLSATIASINGYQPQ